MLYSEIIAVCSQIHTKHANTLGGQKVKFVSVKPGAMQATTGPQRLIVGNASFVQDVLRKTTQAVTLGWLSRDGLNVFAATN
jgi:hypothetical protein